MSESITPYFPTKSRPCECLEDLTDEALSDRLTESLGIFRATGQAEEAFAAVREYERRNVKGKIKRGA